MGVHTPPVQAGGAAVLGASALRSAGGAVVKGRTYLAATGASALQFLAVLGLTLITLGLLLVRRGQGTTLGDRSFD
jgi:LPXTG-motif cell wall-anchored protein